MKSVCVFGTYKDLGKESREEIALLGSLLAGDGFTVVSGGFGGSMEDVSRGAKRVGGRTIGVTYYKKGDFRKRANDYIDEEIRTTDIFERIENMMRISGGFIALRGGTGTLLELAAVLEHVNKGMMPPKPLAAVGDHWKDLAQNLRREPLLSGQARKQLKVSTCGDMIFFARNVREAAAFMNGRLDNTG